MATKFILQLALLVAAVAAVPHKDAKPVASRPNIPDTDVYDCSGHSDGNYDHPFECTRFISCSNGRAFDMACPDCNPLVNVHKCAGNDYLFYKASEDICDWPADTECSPRQPTTDDPPATHPTTTTTTTESPPTEFQCKHKSSDVVWKEGDPCTEFDCQPCGFCVGEKFYYLRCVKTIPDDPRQPVTGVIKKEECDDTWDDEKVPAGILPQDGGSCSVWSLLSEATKQRWYDAECFAPHDVCEWGQEKEDECSGKHWYYDPKLGSNPQDLHCPGELVWDPATEACKVCSSVNNAEGNACC